jgi:hypothetical protein
MVNMHIGHKGEHVRSLQVMLNKEKKNLTPDGDFGRITQAAVKSFQKEFQLSQHGIVDMETATVLCNKVGMDINLLVEKKRLHKFPLHLTSRKAINEIFGDPFVHGFDSSKLKRYTLPRGLFEGGKERVFFGHILLEEPLSRAIEGMLQRKLKFKTFDGCLNKRFIRGKNTNKISTHSWAMALDFDAALNPLGAKPKMSPDIVRIWKDAGFVWGGDFRLVKDGMHFQLVSGY